MPGFAKLFEDERPGKRLKKKKSSQQCRDTKEKGCCGKWPPRLVLEGNRFLFSKEKRANGLDRLTSSAGFWDIVSLCLALHGDVWFSPQGRENLQQRLQKQILACPSVGQVHLRRGVHPGPSEMCIFLLSSPALFYPFYQSYSFERRKANPSVSLWYKIVKQNFSLPFTRRNCVGLKQNPKGNVNVNTVYLIMVKKEKGSKIRIS